MNRRQKSYRRGRFAESIAAFYLRAKGYRILEKRYRTPVGEVDIIAKRFNVIVFVEIKARPTIHDACYAIHPDQKARISRAASYFLARHAKYQSVDCRFDALLFVPWKIPIHIVNAWQLMQ